MEKKILHKCSQIGRCCMEYINTCELNLWTTGCVFDGMDGVKVPLNIFRVPPRDREIKYIFRYDLPLLLFLPMEKTNGSRVFTPTYTAHPLLRSSRLLLHGHHRCGPPIASTSVAAWQREAIYNVLGDEYDFQINLSSRCFLSDIKIPPKYGLSEAIGRSLVWISIFLSFQSQNPQGWLGYIDTSSSTISIDLLPPAKSRDA